MIRIKHVVVTMLIVIITTTIPTGVDASTITQVSSMQELLSQLNNTVEISTQVESPKPLTSNQTVNNSDVSLNAGIPSSIPQDPRNWERYKAINDLEKLHQSQGISPIDEITNPLHYAHTGDPFGVSAREWLYENGYIAQEVNGRNWRWRVVDRENGHGFAYIDKYGYTHVSSNLITAVTYSKDGRVYDFDSTHYRGGYALSSRRDREGNYGILFLSTLEGAKPFDNMTEFDEVSDKKFDLFHIRSLLRRQ